MIITGIEQDEEIADFKAKCLGSFLFFLESFFELKTGKKFSISNPINREPHQLTLAKNLTKVFNLEILRLSIAIAPGHYKSTFCTYFMAWALARFPDCNFIYISYSVGLATEHTANCKSIIEMPEYRKLFGVELSGDSSAKDNFKTKQGGGVAAFGSSGGITGRNAGFPNCNRFSGCVLMDDMHKPDEVFSDTIRESVIKNYMNTIENRPRGPKVPMIFIGHALHESDLRSFLVNGGDGREWHDLKLQCEDELGNILAPDILTREMVDAKKKFNEYVWYSQYQQDPRPPGGGLFKKESFVLLDVFPKMLCTFLTIDTAETDKNYNDPSVFSYWGVYEIELHGRKTGDLGLHLIDCAEGWYKPSDLEGEFDSFYGRCLNFDDSKPFVAIERKSTGVTLISILEKRRGLDIRSIERTKASGSKAARFLEMSPYISRLLISLPTYGKHTSNFITHMSKITLNNTHAHDDIADTCYDAIKIALIDKSLKSSIINPDDEMTKKLISQSSKVSRLRSSAYNQRPF